MSKQVIDKNDINLTLTNQVQLDNLNNANTGINNKQQSDQIDKKDKNFFFKIKNNNIILAILCSCALMQNIIVGGANNAVLTTIERAYYMTSLESALFLSSYDIANIIASPIIGYYGDRKHKPKIIGLSMLGLSLGSFVMILPEFAILNNHDYFDSNSDNETDSQMNQILCIPNNHLFPGSSSNQTLSKQTTSNIFIRNMKYIFYLSNMINGISSVALYTIAISYIEGLFLKEQVHLRQGIYYAVGAIGVGIGMLITGNFLNIDGLGYKKSTLNKSKLLTPNSINWIGAWWIIYIISAALNCILSILVFCFKQEEKLENKKTNFDLKDFIRNSVSILSNRVFLFIIICTTFETFLIKGFSSYLTKYLEYQYRLPASTATMIAGAIGFLSLVLGPISGAYLIKHFKWHIKQCSKFVVLILFLTSFLFLGLIIHCQQESYINNENPNYLKLDCSCDLNSFYPICYKNLFLFQTPCHAGCTKFIKPNFYTKCNLLDNYLLNQSEDISNLLTPCQRPAPFCITNLIIVSLIGLSVLFLSSIVILPILRIILESVSTDNQSFALGIRSLITKLFGNIPGPIVFATIVDKSCVQWTRSPITGNKTCRLYNNKSFSVGLGTLGAGIRFLSSIFSLVTFYFITKQDSLELNSNSTQVISASSNKAYLEEN